MSADEYGFERGWRCVEQMNELIHYCMDGSPASLEGEEYYIEVSVVRKGMTQQAAQGCNRQQQPMRSLDSAI
jgi:hypothetical protein